MPVLVLALGLDVTFIVIRAWHATSAAQAPAERLAEALSDAGPSIVITTLTNVISAGVGTITSLPAIWIFCQATSIAVSMLFVLQLTFFPAVLALGGRRQYSHRHGCFFWLTVRQEKKQVAVIFHKI